MFLSHSHNYTQAVSEEIQSRKTVIKQEAASYKEETIGKYRQVQLNKIHLSSPPYDPDGEVIHAIVRTPSGLYDRGFVSDHPESGTISVKYDPKETGLHEISLKQGTADLTQEAAYKVYVISMSSSEIAAFGPVCHTGQQERRATSRSTRDPAAPEGCRSRSRAPPGRRSCARTTRTARSA